MLFLRMIKGNLEIWQWTFLLAVLLPMTIKDYRTKKINGYLCIITILAALSIRVYVLEEKNITILLDMIPGAIMYVCSVIFKGSIGKGDALVLLFIGSVMGYHQELEALFISVLLTSLLSLILLIIKKADRKTEIPFVPFLSIGVIAGGLI